MTPCVPPWAANANFILRFQSLPRYSRGCRGGLWASEWGTGGLTRTQQQRLLALRAAADPCSAPPSNPLSSEPTSLVSSTTVNGGGEGTPLSSKIQVIGGAQWTNRPNFGPSGTSLPKLSPQSHGQEPHFPAQTAPKASHTPRSPAHRQGPG